MGRFWLYLWWFLHSLYAVLVSLYAVVSLLCIVLFYLYAVPISLYLLILSLCVVLIARYAVLNSLYAVLHSCGDFSHYMRRFFSLYEVNNTRRPGTAILRVYLKSGTGNPESGILDLKS